MVRYRLLLIFIHIPYLISCSNSAPADVISDYSKRLAKVLSTSFSIQQVTQAPALSKSELFWALPNKTIDWTTYFQLSQCDPNQYIAQINTQQFKTSDWSVKLTANNELFKAMLTCKELLIDESIPFDEIIEHLKSKQTPLLFNSLFVDADGYTALIRGGSFKEHDAPGNSETLNTLIYLNKLVDSLVEDKIIDLKNINENLVNLYKYKYLTGLRLTLHQYQQLMRQLNDQLQSYSNSRSCSKIRPAFDKDILSNVIKTQFVDKVQFRIAPLNQQHLTLIERLLTIFEKFDSHPNYERLHTWFTNQRVDLRTEMKKHVSLLQQLLKPCDR